MRAPLLCIALALGGCLRPSTPPEVPSRGAAQAEQVDDPFVVRGALRDEPRGPLGPGLDLREFSAQLPPLGPGVPPPPALCADYAAKVVGPRVAAPTSPSTSQGPQPTETSVLPSGGPSSPCGPGVHAELASALQLSASIPSTSRDKALERLEACTELPYGLVRALRAELAPLACADLLAAPLVEASPGLERGPQLRPELRVALVGLGHAARLSRLATPPPAPPPDLDLARFPAYLRDVLRPWLETQATAIQALSWEGARLPPYGKAKVAAQAARADLGLVAQLRQAPLPKELADDPAFRDVYDPALEQALEPRKVRGRDAGLVALGILAHLGALHDPAVAPLRQLLTQVYGGRPLDALDPLLLPELPAPGPGDPETTLSARLASVLPPFYAPLLLEPELRQLQAPSLVAALSTSGLSPEHRATLAQRPLSAEAHRWLALGRLRAAQKAWRALDVDRAIAHAQAAQQSEPTAEGRLLLALALALRDGPEDASELLLRAPRAKESLGLGNTAALDLLVQERGPLAGLAAFDAALLRQLAAPPNATAAYWGDVARRWDQASTLVSLPAQRAWAKDRADAARQLEASLR